MKKIKCHVCGGKFAIEGSRVYTIALKQLLSEALSKPLVDFDATDCPHCGCQRRLAWRYPAKRKETEQ